MLLLVVITAKGQVTIGGDVYGGGNKAEVRGSTTVTVRSGNIGARPLESLDKPSDDPAGRIFGGARSANVGGNTYVNIDGAHASGYILVNKIFGGNDISGTIGTAAAVGEDLPAELVGNEDGVDNTWNSYVRISSKMTPVYYTQDEINAASVGDPAYGKTTSDIKSYTLADDNKKVFIGQIYAGSNGEFTYTDENGEPLRDESGNYIVKNGELTIATSKTALNVPELDKSYLDIQGGTISRAYGGGNNATIRQNAVIHVDNPSQVVTEIKVEVEEGSYNLMTQARLNDMGLYNEFGYHFSNKYQIGRLFGGNNEADMAIRPQWNLMSGKVRKLYSGGNKGRMIYENGLFLEIPKTSTLVVGDLYGGCRMADVRPMKWNSTLGKYADVNTVVNDIPSYKFPPNLAARVIVAGGDVENVYGGNDIRGRVYFGNAIGIQTSVSGNVYGGGNGSYPYTDGMDYKNDPEYSDFYYETDEVYTTSIEALNALRPNAEQVSIQVRGEEGKPTIIGGSVFIGGNSATLAPDDSHKNLENYPLVELKIGSHVIIDNVFMGNNGEHMVDDEILDLYARGDFSTLSLTDPSVFRGYMDGVNMSLKPRLTTEKTPIDKVDYEDYTSSIGSLYFGGNRGSMTYKGPLDITPTAAIYIYDKLVGGCNNANVAATDKNARYEGGIMGDPSEQGDDGYMAGGKIRDRIVMNLSKIRMKPMRMNKTGAMKDWALEWNTVFHEAGGYIQTDTGSGTGIASDADEDRRLLGANVYGGCCESGHVNGNVVINLNGSLHNRRDIFANFDGEEDGDNILYDDPAGGYNITKRNSGVILNKQGMDVLGDALNVFGGGKGKETEIWGSATVNINRGYTFQVFGGSESGAIGKGTWNASTNQYDYPTEPDERYSTYVNLSCGTEGVARKDNSTEDMADVEFIYGGGFEGPILGNTRVKLDNGRLFNLFAGSCNADINGHTETFVGLDGFPYLRDHIYAGNDLGGKIRGSACFKNRVREEVRSMVHKYNADSEDGADVLRANTYVEYRKGRMKNIFGGNFGDYDYDQEFKGYTFPEFNNAFVNFRPEDNNRNAVDQIFGGSEGYMGYRAGDQKQNRSYVLIDIADNKDYYKNTEVFGGGMNNGVGMGFTPAETFESSFDLDRASAVIDLLNGQIGDAFGGSFQEGITRRTVINVPAESTIKLKNICGGAYGTQILPPCDVYESNVNYRNTSENARVTGAIYGGNNNERRTLFTNVNISSPVWSDKTEGELATVYGAGRGRDTWSEHTVVNLESGAMVKEVYGGGKEGNVLNAASTQAYMQMFSTKPSPDIAEADPEGWGDPERWVGEVGSSELIDGKKEMWAADWKNAWTIGEYFEPDAAFSNYAANTNTNFDRISNRPELDDYTTSLLSGTKKYNTNVIINRGATVTEYAYGGGYGNSSKAMSGDVYGTTYITLLGGTVGKDIYAAGTAGSVNDAFGAESFTASSNAYIKGGMTRNVYGGGWRGSVGYHSGAISNVADNDKDIEGNTYVVIGDLNSTDFYSGRPAIMRNAYGGGEGGGIYGTAHVTLNDGRIGYHYKNTAAEGAPAKYDYVEELHDVVEGDSLLYLSGNVFGGGYVANSYVDHTWVRMYGGVVRGCLYGGGEIGPIGRGTMAATQSATEALGGIYQQGASIYKPGSTHLEMYSGHVLRNAFGGGRGLDNWGGEGFMTPEEKMTMDRSAKGYVFGKTLVEIHGGEIGTEGGVADGFGNVFGGGDLGFVYSAYEDDRKLCMGKKSGDRYDEGDEGAYYKYEKGEGDVWAYKLDGTEKIPTEDCKVLIEPQTKVLSEYKLPVLDGEGKPELDGGGNPKTISYVVNNVTINGHTYKPGEFVPIDDLNTLKNKNADADRWNCLDATGIIIHNAVFAGGNAAIGSSAVHANTTTVYGNATASLHDIYHRDLITLGTGHIGGLYGDGNLTFVDGYRGLNVTNYGTDYYSIKEEIDIDTYHKLPAREAAYYELKYKCEKACTDKDGTRYTPGSESSKASTVNADDLIALFLNDDGKTSVQVDPETGNRVTSGGTEVLMKDGEKWVPKPEYWSENGVLPLYAGRLLNSLQRADFCGVFGSRMVMRGARDRVPEIVDFTNYTINRVREVSLNQQHSLISEDRTLKEGKAAAAKPEDQDPDDFVNLKDAIHGNYFGIYNIVNYLGALTSDVHFTDRRRTSNTSEDYAAESPTQTFYDWKSKYIKYRKRNNGTSLNKVALASGVYLELTSEKGTGTGLYEKDWGYVTGIIELDLINVQPGIGGGFVYAKNVHGAPSYSAKKHATLTELNKDALTRKDFTYNSGDLKEWETSGNFIHSTQTIIDDCYNISGKYSGSDAVPAHYWYIKGSVYVYDQYISAYTGAPNAYSKSVEIPLTIAAASHGTMKLLNVQPNRYAYYATTDTPIEDGKKININDVVYYKNDPISYWDWYLLSKSEKNLFVSETYVTVDSCKINGKFYPPGYVMLPNEYDNLKLYAEAHQEVVETGKDPVPAVQKATVDANGNPIVLTDDKGNTVYKAFDFVFRESNNLSHDKGYILSYEMTNPTDWDTWYTPKTGVKEGKITSKAYNGLETAAKDNYHDGPTYRIEGTGAMLGQRDYTEGNVISKNLFDSYESVKSHVDEAVDGVQATFVPAYIVTEQFTVTDKTGTHHMYPGSTVSQEVGLAHSGSAELAYICTNTIQLGPTEYIYVDTKMTAGEKAAYISSASSAELEKEIEDNIVPAYYCTSAGRYGGNYYESNKNYRGLEAWSSMSEEDRARFLFNYDALDLLIDPDYTTVDGNGPYSEGHKYQYDGEFKADDGKWYFFDSEDQAKTNAAGYSLTRPVDYTATYDGNTPLTYVDDAGVERDANAYRELSRTEFERLPNEKRHYTPITPNPDTHKVYVVHSAFQLGSTPYAVGQTISFDEYNTLGEEDKKFVTVLEFGAGDTDTYYYCRESYEIDADSGSPVKGISVTGVKESGEYAKGATVPVGAVIEKTNDTSGHIGYENLKNDQANFTIHGISPTETSTLYVSRASDIFDLSKEKIITVIYQYDYEESDINGNVTPVSERHVVNIHLQFESGVPTIEDIKAPKIILPGEYIGMRDPVVTPGAYEVTGSGWEVYERIHDAENHSNGIEFDLDKYPFYWYQDGHYVSYFAKTYLGKTYSNHVPISVANYHDLKKVMDDLEHHYYIDNPDVKREPKIYIKDYTTDDPATTQNGIDLLKNLFDLSFVSSSGGGYTVASDGEITAVDGAVKGANTALKDHYVLNRTKVQGANNLWFYLQSDIDHSQKLVVDPDDPEKTKLVDDPWTPIAPADGSRCFEGTLHGDGHTISGLSNSLFGRLCGNVYNLGVEGSFNTAGVVDTGDGYVESCWVKTSSTTPLGTKPNAVFGNPTGSGGRYQVVNSYFLADNKDLYGNIAEDGTKGVTTSGDARGKAVAKSARAFYNGELAYDLNNFYLYKRYSDHTALDGSSVEYKYWKPGEPDPQTASYPNHAELCSSGYGDIRYVEERFADGDFIYAAGEIPDEDDVRLYTDLEGNRHYYPIWPDDYLFFGQALNYGHVDELTHQKVPTAVVRRNGRVRTDMEGNRVYRAPAYYRSSTMEVAHFNPYAVFAQSEKDHAEEVAYKDMTAIDFTGYNDVFRVDKGHYGELKDYQLGMNAGRFYQPLLDDDGLVGFLNADLTKNLLVYTAKPGTTTAAEKTGQVVSDYLFDPMYREANDAYRTVTHQVADGVFGHWVNQNGAGYTAQNDHLLVDKNDFNAPISYTFAPRKRMWYQRLPEDNEFVDTEKGWQGISLPFSAELVTTEDKGEITHFYNGSYKYFENNVAKKDGPEGKQVGHVGHEYWLREFTNITSSSDPAVYTANFTYPSSEETDQDKEVTNTFLWDYYYEGVTPGGHDHKDQNTDTYQSYYQKKRTYRHYPQLEKGTPYLLGLPGKTFYEFDLSGNFEATTTAIKNPVKLSKKYITFASNEGETIGVSDNETTGKTFSSASYDYTFKPSYMNEVIDGSKMTGYAIDTDGDSYDKVAADKTVTVSAFRPFFISKTKGSTSRPMARSIVFSNNIDGFGEEYESDADGALTITSRLRHIIVTSTLKAPREVSIVNASGVVLTTFTIAPGQTIETRVNLPGLYIVNKKKIAVR